MLWQPNSDLNRDISDGGMYRRYFSRLNDAKNDDMIAIYDGVDMCDE